MPPLRLLSLLTLAMLTACSGAIPSTVAERDLLDARCKAAVNDFKAKDKSLDRLITSAHAYAVFPDVVSGAAGIGGAHGEGEVFQKGKLIGYAEVSQFTIGAQLGGQSFSQLILFENELSFVNFTHSQMEMDARVSAVAASSGAADTANYRHGVIVFTMTDAGLMFQAALGGQKFHYEPLLKK
jgi:lipid-binding SYLF domain-containing protein